MRDRDRCACGRSKLTTSKQCRRCFLADKEADAITGAHPNSLQARAGFDRDLRERINEGRRRAHQDLNAMEHWARREFGVGRTYGRAS